MIIIAVEQMSVF